MALLERARFEQSFSFLFSPRPHTVAALRMNHGPGWEEVPREVAVARLERLQTVQRRIAAENFAAQLGRTVEVLVEGPSDEPGEVRGRTPENRVVHLAAAPGVGAGRRGRARPGSPAPGRARSRACSRESRKHVIREGQLATPRGAG